MNASCLNPVSRVFREPPLSEHRLNLGGAANPNSDRYSRFPMIPSPPGSVCGARNLNGVANFVHWEVTIQLQLGKP